MATLPDGKAISTTMRNLKKFSLILTTVFLILEAVLIAHHEMWRDEIQPWIIVRNSSSIYMMFQHLIAEVHPGLWYLMLYALSYFTDSPLGMQILHLIIAGAIVYIFARYSPFTKLQKVLFAFGYMIVYEYATISRSYSTGVLLIFILMQH